MTLKTAALFAFIGSALLTAVCAVGVANDLSSYLAGAVAPAVLVASLIHLVASLSVAVFFFVFARTRA